jgi:SOS regulatory protein LexA
MTKTPEMDQKLNRIYKFIMSMYEKGYPPTVRDIAGEFGIKSTSSVAYYINKLEERGLIRKQSGKSRALEVLNPNKARSKNFVNIPLVGTITAGKPITAEEYYEDTYTFPVNLFRSNGDLFMLTVEGTSMIEVGINDGDKIIVKKQDYAESGQIIAALIDEDCATVKRYFRDGDGKVRLHPENKNMPDIYPENLRILGVVTGLVRTEIK